MSMRITTPSGRVLDVTDEVQPEGRVVYRVAGLGAFTLERNAYGYPDPESADHMECTYGVLTGERRFYGRGALPEAPVLFGITIGGAAVYQPERFTEEEWRWPLPMQRATEERTYSEPPDRTRRRITDVVGALTVHFLDRTDRPDIEHAQAARLAPERLNMHRRKMADLAEEIATRQETLRHEALLADVQADLLAAEHADETLTA